ncbi:MAG: hypothetical protein ACRDJT_12040 [Actinomycetota bacterium]
MKSFLTVAATTALLLAPATAGRTASISADAPTVTTVNPEGACGNSAGSSDATFDSNNHRMVVTSGGRVIVAYDPHGFGGVDLAWKDPGGGWKEKSVFDDGLDEVSNDRPASIALDGTGQAWVVWSGPPKRFGPVKMRRLTNLDAASGPTVGPALTVQNGGPHPDDPDDHSGGAAVDLAFHGGRGHIVWLQKTDSGYSLTADSFTDLDNPTPPLLGRTILAPNANEQTTATLVSTPEGMRAVARTGDLRLFRYGSSGWTSGSAETAAPATARPSAVAFGGDVLAAFQSSSNPGAVTVARFSDDGDSVGTSPETGDGYVEPAIAASGSRAWLIMVRASRRSVVSRTFNGSSWGGDATLMTASGGDGDFTWPNTLREVGGTLRFLVGQRCTQKGRTSRSAVLSFEQKLNTTPLTTTITGPKGPTNDDTPTFEFKPNRAVTLVECGIDKDDLGDCPGSHKEEGPLEDGPYTFYVRAVDGIDVEDPPAERSFRVDTRAPKTSITNHPPRRTKAHNARFSFGADETKSTFICKRDRGRFRPCSSPKVYRGLERGRHTFRVRAEDRAGNVDPTASVWRWRIKRR